MRISLFSFSTLAGFVIPDAYQKRIPFKTFQSFNRFASFQMGISPFQTFQLFQSLRICRR